MSLPRHRSRAAFGLSVMAAGLMGLLPSGIGHQDLAALAAQRPIAAAPAHSHIIASPFGTIEKATFSLPPPISEAMPPSLAFVLAGLDPGNADITGAIRERILGDMDLDDIRASSLPQVERRLKGDRLALPPPPEEEVADQSTAEMAAPQPAPPATQPAPRFSVEALEDGPDDDEPTGYWPDLPARPAVAEVDPDIGEPLPGEAAGVDATMRLARLYFSVDPASPHAMMRPWSPGEVPQLDADASIGTGGETIAAKGEVTGVNAHPMSPAERLHLDEKGRAKAMRCLTQAIYFEARGEPVRGQIAVAQVVMNRVFSGYYPGTVCGVVYQNANRHLACQFTFACDGLPEVVREPDAWERAKRIAGETLDGELWLPEVGKATHYHAYWVHPSWVHEMTRMYKLGVHTFYRPKRWGDGADAPEWGDAAVTAAAAKNL
jgi:hypothetical protein